MGSTGIIDVARLAKAVERPGIDPRPWLSLAAVTAVVCDDEGPLVDIQLLPDDVSETARVGTLYAGPDYGIFMPLGVGDEVLVAAPQGDPNEGLVVIARLHSASDPPPPDVAASSGTDLVIHAKDGANINITVTGGGKITFGESDATENMVLGQQWKAMMEAFLDAVNAITVPTGVGPSGVPINLAQFEAIKNNLDAQLSDIIFGKKTT